jgi:glycosyltransferase involved in cell wall biosynthesis
MLSVRLMAYKHEPFIAQAIESVLAQEVDFTYEIVIGDDVSPDRTPDIIRDYQSRYPDRIRFLVRDNNMGNIRNFVDIVNNCRGKYIALLDGDDYWTSTHKLQKQVDFLEAHPECSGCFHNVTMIHDDATELNRNFHENPLAKSFFDLKDIVSSHFIPTCSTVFRARLFDRFPDWFMEMPMADWPLHVLNAQHGQYAYIDEVMAAYRIHGGGLWSGKSRLAVVDRTIMACQRIDRSLEGSYSRELGRFIRDFEIEASGILAGQFEFSKAAKRLFNAFCLSPTSCSRISKCSLRLLSSWLKQLCGIRSKDC